MNTSGQSQIDQARIEWAIRLKYSPLPKLDMALVASQLNAFRIGDLALAARTWEIMIERDADLTANIFKRCEDVAGLDYEIMSDGTPEGDQHKAALEYVYDHCQVTDALDQDSVGSVHKLIWNIAFAHAVKYSTHEMLLRVDNAAARQVTYEFRLTPVWFFECRRGYLGWLPHVFDVYGQPLASGEWLPAVGYGHMRACSVLYAMKHFPLRDWLLYCSRYGFPQIQLLTDATKGSPEWNALIDAYESLANDSVIITNTGVEVRPIEVATKGELPFRPIIDDVNRQYAKLFRGSDLATSSKESAKGGGPTVGASVQGGEKDILLASDAAWVTPILNERVDRPTIRYLFNTEPRAWIKILPPSDDNTQNDLLTAQFCVANGVTIGIKTARERFNWPEPDPAEPVLQPQMAPPGMPGQTDSAATPQGGNPTPAAPAPQLAPGAHPGPNQRPDPGMPGGNQPMTAWSYPGGQERALSNGDVPGHEFHGNQWTAEQFDAQAEQLEKESESGHPTTVKLKKQLAAAYRKRAGMLRDLQKHKQTMAELDRRHIELVGGHAVSNAAAAALQTTAVKHYAGALSIPIQLAVKKLFDCFRSDDPDIVKNQLTAYSSWLGKNREHLAGDPAAAEALYEAMSASLVNGLTTKPPKLK